MKFLVIVLWFSAWALAQASVSWFDGGPDGTNKCLSCAASWDGDELPSGIAYVNTDRQVRYFTAASIANVTYRFGDETALRFGTDPIIKGVTLDFFDEAFTLRTVSLEPPVDGSLQLGTEGGDVAVNYYSTATSTIEGDLELGSVDPNFHASCAFLLNNGKLKIGGDLVIRWHSVLTLDGGDLVLTGPGSKILVPGDGANPRINFTSAGGSEIRIRRAADGDVYLNELIDSGLFQIDGTDTSTQADFTISSNGNGVYTLSSARQETHPLPGLVDNPHSPGGLPNVVMIMADDFGWCDMAAYRRYANDLDDRWIDDPIQTPNMDRLVANGMMFTDAHSPAALCSPTRFSMMTGSNPYRNGQRWGTWDHDMACAVISDYPHTTVGDLLTACGYQTAFIGKMHLGGASGGWTTNSPSTLTSDEFDAFAEDYTRPMPYFPSKYGFHYSFCVPEGIQKPPYMYFENDRFVRLPDPSDDPFEPFGDDYPCSPHPRDYGTAADLHYWTSQRDNDPPGANGENTIQGDDDEPGNKYEGWGDKNWNTSQNGIINSRKAVFFIRKHREKHSDRPFLLYYAPPQPHYPHCPPIDFDPKPNGEPRDPLSKKVLGKTGGNDAADMIYELDLQVGAILDALKDPDGDGDHSDSILANTLVIFTSDNGGLSGHKGFEGLTPEDDYSSTGPLRGTKHTMWEGGHRVPFVARWGDGTCEGSVIQPGTVCHQTIGAIDWVATLYEITGQAMQPLQCMDSQSLMPLLTGGHDESESFRDFLLLQNSWIDGGRFGPGEVAIRWGPYVQFFADDCSSEEDHHQDDIEPIADHLFNLAEDIGQTTNIVPFEIIVVTTTPGAPVGLRLPIDDYLTTLYKAYDECGDPRSTAHYSGPITREYVIADFSTALTGHRIAFTGEAGKRYRLEFARSLDPDAWSQVDSYISSKPGPKMFERTAPTDGFYRILDESFD
jgi:arylsulfatase A-like enzyme